MNNKLMLSARGLLTMSLVTCALLVLGACAPKVADGTYATPEEAVAALVTAMEKDDTAALTKLLGPGSEALVSSGDAVADRNARANFVTLYKAKHSLVPEGADMTLVVGANDWPTPVPLVQRDGRWAWDGAAGADELIFRRVGANELGAIDVCRGYVQAQFDYASEGRDGDPPGIGVGRPEPVWTKRGVCQFLGSGSE